ncbi:hypothetical protein H312_02240 [Anncaliia algerae PRA339]|uniref:Uncharacterized protein n=1 Tax=Anncaliia algerae PRA339 TaxID=1288291 RepID=A0A059EZT3_9MICR|nr:hypothetical protein H312_02240 [Anncaliia algerae PRA339]
MEIPDGDGPNLRLKATEIPSEIRILGGPNNLPGIHLPQLDLISADDAETFTFEEFRKLIYEARSLNKDFLLARVTTNDPKDNALFFNYYYSANEINKILFKYESSRKLLHRMKVKNPLNNMYIVGQVYYYKITLENYDKAVVDYFFSEKPIQRKKTRRAFSTILRNKEIEEEHDRIDNKRSKDTNDIRLNVDRDDAPQKDPLETINDVRRGLIFIPTEIKKEMKITFDAKYFGSDDDFLLKQEIRDYFRNNSPEGDEEEQLFELDRTNNDLFALLDANSEEEDDDSNGWKRVLTAHMSVLMSTLCIIILFGANPLILVIAFGVSLLVFASLLFSMAYVMCCRREAFDTLAVRSVEDV